MAQFQVADQARTDLDEIWDHLYREAGEAVADTETGHFYEEFQTLAEYHFMGSDGPELVSNIRSVPGEAVFSSTAQLITASRLPV